MSICPRVGGAGQLPRPVPGCTDFYHGLEASGVRKLLPTIPLVGEHGRPRLSSRSSDGAEGVLHGGMLFEELGFRYIGPVDGHDLPALRKLPARGEGRRRARCCCTSSPRRGTAFQQASEDPVTFHTPPVVREGRPGRAIIVAEEGRRRRRTPTPSAPPSTTRCSDDPKVAVHDGRDVPGEQAGEGPRRLPRPLLRRRHLRVARRRLRRRAWPRPGMRPIVDIYTTFLQRQLRPDLPGGRPAEPAGRLHARPRRPDRARRADAPRHASTSPTCGSSRTWSSWPPATRRTSRRCSTSPCGTTRPSSIRYPKANLETIDRAVAADRAGPGRGPRVGDDGMFLAFGTLLPAPACRRPSGSAQRDGLRRRRRQRPVRQAARPATILQGDRGVPFVVTVEEGTLEGGFGTAVLEAANDAGLSTRARRPAAASPTASSSTPSATSCSPRSASTSTASPRRPWSWPGPSACRPS